MWRFCAALCVIWGGVALAAPAKPAKVKAKASASCQANNKPIKGPIPKDTTSINCFVTTTHVDTDLGAPYASLRIWTTTLDTESSPKVSGTEPSSKTRRFEELDINTDFRTCADMVVHMQLTDGDDAIWQQDTPVAWACAKPKPLAAKVTCAQQDQGKAVPLPAGKRGERFHADLECRITSKDKRFTDGSTPLKIFGDSTWKNTGSGPGDAGTPGTQHREGAGGGGGGATYYDLAFGSDEWDRCADIDFTIMVTDENSSPMFKQTFKTKHTCGE